MANCAQLAPPFVVCSITDAEDEFFPSAKHAEVEGHEMVVSELVAEMTVGVPHVVPLIDTKAPPSLTFPEAKQTVDDGQEIPVVEKPSC